MAGLSAAALLASWDRGLGETSQERAVTMHALATGCSRIEAGHADLGTRDAALLDLLQAITRGNLWCTASCRWCDQRLDVPIDPGAMPRSPASRPGALHETRVGQSTVRFRLPTVEDLVELAELAGAGGEGTDHIGRARRTLLARCVVDGGQNLTDQVADAVEQAMEAVSPGLAVTVVVACPACGHDTEAALDVPLLVWTEVQAQALSLLTEVHALATAYGWTESDVLALSPARRAAYLELVDW